MNQTLVRVTGPAVGIKDKANFAETVVATDFVPTLILTKSVFVITFVVVSAAETVSDADCLTLRTETGCSSVLRRSKIRLDKCRNQLAEVGMQLADRDVRIIRISDHSGQ